MKIITQLNIKLIRKSLYREQISVSVKFPVKQTLKFIGINLFSPVKNKLKHFKLPKLSQLFIITYLCTGSLLLNSIYLHADTSHTKSKDETLFRVAFIYNFAKFTNWPENILAQEDSLILCTIGKQKVGQDLKRLSGKIIKGRQVKIKTLTKLSTDSNCHMLYISNSERKNYLGILKKINNKSVLTVSDIAGFAHNGGIIQFYRKKGQTRLKINLDAAHKVDLEISSRLLILADVISNRVTP